jgi:hypothetical protein
MRQKQYCSRCQKLKTPEEFPNPDAYKASCWVCGHRGSERARKHKYGITPSDFENLLIQSEGKCMICKESFGKGKVCIDHNHTTGKVRGVVCDSCNKGLGFFKDNSIVLDTAIQYLEANV